jgi:hypothetical protein
MFERVDLDPFFDLEVEADPGEVQSTHKKVYDP